MALALKKLTKVDMPLNKETKQKNFKNYTKNVNMNVL